MTSPELDIQKVHFLPESIRLDQGSAELLEKTQSMVAFKPGQYLADTKSVSANIYYIVSGECRVLGNLNGRLKPLCRIGRGEIVGLASLLNTVPSELVTAANNVIAASLPESVIYEIYKKNSEFRRWCSQHIWRSEFATLISIIQDDVNTYSKDFGPKEFDELYSTAKIVGDNEEVTAGNQGTRKYFWNSHSTEFRRGTEVLDDKLIRIGDNCTDADRIISIVLDSNMSNISNENKHDGQEHALNTNIPSGPGRPVASSVFHADEYKLRDFRVERVSRHGSSLRACTRMIAKWYGINFRADMLDKAMGGRIDAEETKDLKQAERIFPSLGIIALRGVVRTEFFSRLATPALLICDDEYNIAIKASDKGWAIASPKKGLYELSPSQILDTFKESAEVITFTRNSLKSSDKFTIEWFVPALLEHKSALFQVLAASFVIQIFTLGNPLIVQVIIDKVINQRSLDTLQVLGVALVFVTLAEYILTSLRTILFTDTTNHIDEKLGLEVIDYLLRVPIRFFEKRSTGELGSRIAELEKIRSFLTGTGLTTIIDSVFSIIYVIIMFMYSWVLAIVALCVVPIQIALTVAGSPVYKRFLLSAAEANAKTNGYLIESIGSIGTIKTQNIESTVGSNWRKLYNGYIRKTFKRIIVGTFLGQTSQLFQKLSQLMVLWVGATLVLRAELTLGQLIAFRIISGYVTQPLLRLGSIWQNVQEMQVSINRLGDILETKTESDLGEHSYTSMPTIKGNVSVDNISFGFGRNKKILKSVSFEVDQGSFVGVVGKSGSGKSTLMKIMARLYELDSGRIFIDDVDISKVELYSLRSQLGFVPQEPLLFSGSVYENIAITRPSATSEEVVLAAQIACAHTFIMELPNGYNTEVGERGSALSGGQKQRITLARSILTKPGLLILDEATSALDAITEKQVCNSLIENFKSDTVFFVTHRLASVRNADKILLFDDGYLKEHGSHEELVAAKGLYYSMIKEQGAEA